MALGRRWGYAGRLEPFLFPARRAYLRFASGVIVHNRQAEADVRWACPDVPVRCVPLAVAQLPPGDHDLWRARLGVAPSDLLMVHLGFLTRAKGLDVVLRSLVALGEIGVAARLVMVGEGSERGALEASVASAGLAERVRIWGYATPEALGGILGARRRLHGMGGRNQSTKIADWGGEWRGKKRGLRKPLVLRSSAWRRR